jgi:AraC-like DNA-binding protein
VDYSADTQRTSLGWLSVMFALTLITIPVPLAGMMLDLDMFSNFWTSIQGVLPAFFIYPILCYNLLSDNYVIMSPDDENLPDKNTYIAPKNFSIYMRDKKPFLNPKLEITDICKGFGTNRTYLSAFINQEYGMSFSRFINRCRLEELDRLRTLSPDKERENMDFVLKA